MGDKYLETWTSPEGKTRRHLDYIAINAKYRDTARKSNSNIYGRASMRQNRQRRVQTMQLYYNASKPYKTPTPQDTGGELKYDIRELRLRPENLTKWYQEQEQEKNMRKHGQSIQVTGRKTRTHRQRIAGMVKLQEQIRDGADANISAQKEEIKPDGSRMGDEARAMGK